MTASRGGSSTRRPRSCCCCSKNSWDASQLQFVGGHADLAARDAFTAFLAPLRKAEWVVYAILKSP